MKRPTFRAFLALGVGMFAIGISPILVRMTEAPGPVTSFYRMGIAVIILAVPFFRRVNTQGSFPSFGVKMAVYAGLFFALDLASWATGVVLSGATNPTLLANTAPIWTGLGAMFFLKEKQPLSFWGGLILAFIGAALILGLDTFQSATLGIGSFYGLLAGIFYGGYFLFVQRSRKELDVLSFFWIACFTSSIVLLGLTILLQQPVTGYSLDTYFLFLIIGLLVQLIGWYVISYAQGHLPATLVAPTLLGQPVITAILASIFLNEEITNMEVVGGFTILLGVYTVHRHRRGEFVESNTISISRET
ncbi:MAG: DMT family transporter [Anaerolineales bacterium]